MKSTTALRHAWMPLLALGLCGGAQAFVVPIAPDKRALYLRVGDGNFAPRTYSQGGNPRDSSGPANTVGVVVPAAQVGNGSAQLMTSNSRLTSDYDGYEFCNAGQTYIGGFFRGDAGAGTATLSVSVLEPLTNGSGETIPFSQIQWSTSGNGPDGAIAGQPVADGRFTGSLQGLAGFAVNTWRETCFTFSYRNDAVVATGTYVGSVIYTLTSP